MMAAARRHAGAVLVAAAALTVLGVVLVTRITFDANILRLLPQRSPAVQSFRTFLEDFGSLDHVYVVFESPDSIDDRADFVDAYVEALRGAPEIASVDAQIFEPGKDWTYLSDRALLLLGPDEAAQALARLKPPALDVELRHARDLLSMPSADVKTYVQQDPLGWFGVLRTRMEREKNMLAFDPSRAGYVSPDGRARLVMVRPTGAPFDSRFCKALFARLAAVERAARDKLRADGVDVSNVAIQTAGAYRVSLEAEALIRTEGVVNSLGSLVLLLAVVYAVFRTPWVLVFGTLPLAIAAVLSLGINGWLRGSLSPATSGSAGMLFGLGIDGIIVLYVRYLEEQRRGASEAETTRGLAKTGASVALAQATSVATFLALLVLDFPTLQDLGALVGLGILLVSPLTLLLLPALLAKFRGGARGRLRTAPWLGRLVTERAGAILWTSAVATAVLGVASLWLRADLTVERLQARTSGADLERAIVERFSLPRDVLLVVNRGLALEPLLETEARLAETMAATRPGISVSGASVLLPSTTAQGAVADAIAAASPPIPDVIRAVREAGARAGFRPDTFAPFFERLPRALDPAQRITYQGLIDHGLGEVLSRFVARDAQGYTTVTYLYPRDPVDLPALDALVRSVDPRLQLTGVSVINRELARTFLPAFLRGIAIGTAAVFAILLIVLRSVRDTALALLHTVVGFIWSAGLLAILRVELDLFSIFAAVTFVGIAVDYGVYVLYRQRREGSADLGDVLSRTGAAIGIACLTALIGFGSLVNSSYRPMRVFGVVAIVTLSCCLVTSIVSLPALLVQWSKRGAPSKPAR